MAHPHYPCPDGGTGLAVPMTSPGRNTPKRSVQLGRPVARWGRPAETQEQ